MQPTTIAGDFGLANQTYTTDDGKTVTISAPHPPLVRCVGCGRDVPQHEAHRVEVVGKTRPYTAQTYWMGTGDPWTRWSMTDVDQARLTVTSTVWIGQHAVLTPAPQPTRITPMASGYACSVECAHEGVKHLSL